MLLPVLALAALLGLMAGLAVYLFMQQKQQAAGGAPADPAAPAAAPRVGCLRLPLALLRVHAPHNPAAYFIYNKTLSYDHLHQHSSAHSLVSIGTICMCSG